MKLIVIAGSQSSCGKSNIACKLIPLLKDVSAVKLGQGKESTDPNTDTARMKAAGAKSTAFLPTIATLEEIKEKIEPAKYLVIESNRILESITPDMVVYVPGDDPKPSAKLAQEKADLVVGGKISCAKAWEIAEKLDLPRKQCGKLLNKLEVKLCECQLGCF